MKTYENFWIITVVRGVLAIIIGSAILIVPDMAHILLFLPFAVAIAILSLVVYGIVDSLLIFVSSFVTPIRSMKSTLRLQSVAGLCLGALFWSILLEKIQLEWFLYLIALQAAATAYAEYVIARHTSQASQDHGSRLCYSAAFAALVCATVYAAIAITASQTLTTREITYLAYVYLSGFGIAQTLMASRMLYIGRHPGQEHPAHIAQV